MQVGIELVNEDAPRPPVLDRFPDVKRACFRVLQAIKQDTILFPRNLCSKLLHNFGSRPRFSEGAHIFEIARGVTGQFRKLTLKIGGKTVDHLCTPAFPLLAGKDIAPNLPIMQDKLGIGCECGLDLGCSDALLYALNETVIKLCTSLVHNSRGGDFRLALMLSKTSLVLLVIRVSKPTQCTESTLAETFSMRSQGIAERALRAQ